VGFPRFCEMIESPIYEALSRRVIPDYACRLLSAFPVTASGRVDLAKTQTNPELIEPLSERELEVWEYCPLE
jgi:hypothetical protein